MPGTGLIHGVVALSSTEALVARSGQFYYSLGTTWTAKLAIPNPAISRIRFDTYNFDGNIKTVVVDGVNDPAYFNHTTKTMAYGTSIPADVTGSEIVRVFKNHIFFSKGRLLHFTVPFTDHNFSTGSGGGVINVGDNITGLVVFRDQLIIFCQNKIYRFVGNTSSDFNLLPITNNTGCLCGDTIQEVGGDIMYLGPDGIRYLSASERDNDFGLVRASEKIQLKVLEVINANCIYSSVTIAEKNQYRLFYYLPNVEVSNSKGFLATKYSNQTVDNIAWADLKGFKVYGISKYQQRDGETILFVGDTGFVYRMEVGSDLDGANIEAIFETPYTPINDPKIRKTIYKHTLYARPTGLFDLVGQIKYDYMQPLSSPASPFSISFNSGSFTYGDIGSVYGSAIYGSPSEEQFFNNVTGSGFVVAVRYTSNDKRPPYNLNFIVLEYRSNERR